MRDTFEAMDSVLRTDPEVGEYNQKIGLVSRARRNVSEANNAQLTGTHRAERAVLLGPGSAAHREEALRRVRDTILTAKPPAPAAR